ncbi:MAG: endopeptidase La [Anaerolineae bacterium]|nr:endopeptidase La [Anaerolineae bacterium]
MGYGENDFYDVQDAEQDAEGLIEAPLVALRDLVVYPSMVTPLFVGRESSLLAIQTAQAEGQTVIGVAQYDPSLPSPGPDDLFPLGTEMAMGRVMRMPDGTVSVLAQGRRRVEIVEFVSTQPYIRVKARPIPEEDELLEIPRQTQAHMRAVLALFEKCVNLNHNIPEEAYIYAMNIDDPGWLADAIASTLNLTLDERQTILEIIDPAERLRKVGVYLGRELDVLQMEDEIQSQVQREVDRGQREMLLREQMRVIQNELGEMDVFQQELADLRDQFLVASMPEDVREKAFKELGRLTMLPAMAPEVGIIRTYLDWLLGLPWLEMSEDNLDIAHAAKVLDAAHYGLPKAKERVLEHIAVRKIAPDRVKTPVLCFVGPPGTGKTSMGRSIAEALGREFVRVSLGGVRDEAEIRGHRRTYVGAMPGRIIQTMRRVKTVNPVFMLDEIDKLGQDFRGDPSSALLEVLDPEQNDSYSDHYLEMPYDLSKVMFITTANYLDPLPPALLDRLELIEFMGYTEEEKLAIARQFLLPEQLAAHGLDEEGIRFEDSAIREIIRDYTFEAGVRNLNREIATVCRKIARRVAEGKSHPRRVRGDMLPRYLGSMRYMHTLVEDQDLIGVATGVAWTEAGGDIMVVEAALMPGKGDLQLTGQLGEVMRESGQAALTYARARADMFDIAVERFEESDIHIHVPEGAIPKDGPSAGVTMTVALISALTRRPIRREVAMTGEITLRGRVLPVGGIKEKLLAAHRAGLKEFYMPAKNKSDLDEMPRRVLKEMQVVMVDHVDAVLEQVLLPAVDSDEVEDVDDGDPQSENGEEQVETS